MAATHKGLPKMALYLGYGGLIPFLVLSIISILNYSMPQKINIPFDLWLAIYAAVIISFLGAIYWGIVIANSDQLGLQTSDTLLLYSIVPSLLAWFSFLFELKTCLFLLGFIVIACFIVDCLLLFKNLNPTIAESFKRLRLHLTIIVSASLFLTAINLT